MVAVRSNEVSEQVQPFIAHGVDLNTCKASSNKQVWGTCPFCTSDGKFSVNQENNKWDCKSCGEKGNSLTFLRMLHKLSLENTTDVQYEELAKERKLLYPETLKEWGVAKSILTGEWLVPGDSAKNGKLEQLYRYVKENKTGNYRLYATPGFGHQLHCIESNLNPSLKQDTYKRVFVCEGPWDAMALWEILAKIKHSSINWDKIAEGKYQTNCKLTSDITNSVLKDSLVIAVPGANVFFDAWLPLFENREVYLLYDNDHPRRHSITKKLIEGSGYLGMRSVVKKLITSEYPPTKTNWLKWGREEEHYHDERVPSGYDIRDHLAGKFEQISNPGGKEPEQTLGARKKRFEELLPRIQPIPHEWVLGETIIKSVQGKSKNKKGGKGKEKYKSDKSRNGTTAMELLDCTEWKVLVKAWRKPMRWTEGLDRALSVMLAVIISTKAVGDQLWCKIVSPPSSGKSVLCEAIGTCKEYTFSRSFIKGFVSGYKTDKAGDEDHSLIAKLYDKTLLTKDGDTLLQSPNLSQILSQARDMYDRATRSSYNNAVNNEYEGLCVTWILCGTTSLRKLDTSELGERFVDCVIMEGIDDDLEDDVLERVANRAFGNMSCEMNGKAESQVDPNLAYAMQLTGGYVKYIRENATKLLSNVQMSTEDRLACAKLGKFVAYARARPSKTQDEVVEREFGARLVQQYVRLAVCLSAVLNKTTVDYEVMRRVRQCAMDTARGKTLDILKVLYKAGKDGMKGTELSIATNEPSQKQIHLLRFLRKIRAVEPHTPATTRALKGVIRWRLSARFHTLYRQILEMEVS